MYEKRYTLRADSGKWERVETTGPVLPCRAHHSTTLCRGKLFIVGGICSHFIGNCELRNMMAVDCKTLTVVKVPLQGPLPSKYLFGHTAAYYPNEIVIASQSACKFG